MIFSFQLRADDLPSQLGNVFVPEQLRGAGKIAMFQLWLCHGEEHAAWMCDDPQKSLLTGARWIDASGTSATPSASSTVDYSDLMLMQDTGVGYEPEQALLGWEQPKIDTPVRDEQQEVWRIEEVNEEAETIDGPKLSGFPTWVQDVTYPKCPQCNARMEVFFQTAADYMETYLFVCPTHREQFGLEMQCG